MLPKITILPRVLNHTLVKYEIPLLRVMKIKKMDSLAHIFLLFHLSECCYFILQEVQVTWPSLNDTKNTPWCLISFVFFFKLRARTGICCCCCKKVIPVWLKSCIWSIWPGWGVIIGKRKNVFDWQLWGGWYPTCSRLSLQPCHEYINNLHPASPTWQKMSILQNLLPLLYAASFFSISSGKERREER